MSVSIPRISYVLKIELIVLGDQIKTIANTLADKNLYVLGDKLVHFLDALEEPMTITKSEDAVNEWERLS